MNDMIKMVVVLTILSSVSGGLLASVHDGTKAQIENQQLKFVKGPAIKTILKGSTNDPITDRFKIQDGDVERSFFVGKIDGKANTIAFESFGKGFGGDIGVMIGVNLDEDKLVGVSVTTHSETPGLGAKAKEDPSFSAQFKSLSTNDSIKVTNDGGSINAISGATITSRAVCDTVGKSLETYKKIKPQLAEQIKAF
ncbi:MAG: RnfABCDGE type electron transport complex subunit G [Desulfobacteraceae bacterium]|nr:MAG: RnfABCDGE type electron transport complex subunit G [Desulfobacteraceae bacterium]